MSLATEAVLKDLGYTGARFGLSGADWTGFLATHIGAASRRTTERVGSTIYADAESGSPTDPARAADLALAESHLCAAHMLTALRLRLTSGLGSFSASHTSRSMGGDHLEALNEAVAAEITAFDTIVVRYVALSVGGDYIGYVPSES